VKSGKERNKSDLIRKELSVRRKKKPSAKPEKKLPRLRLR